MAGKFEIETSTAGMFNKAGSATGSPVRGLIPFGITICGSGVEVTSMVWLVDVDIGVSMEVG